MVKFSFNFLLTSAMKAVRLLAQNTVNWVNEITLASRLFQFLELKRPGSKAFLMLILAYLIVVIIKSFFISTYSFLFAAYIIRPTLSADVFKWAEISSLTLPLTFALMLLYLSNIVFARIFSLHLARRQVERMDECLSNWIKDKSITKKLLCSFVFYFPAIFIISSLFRWLIWGEFFPDFIPSFYPVVEPMSVLSGTIRIGQKSIDVVFESSTKSSTAGTGSSLQMRNFSSYITLNLKSKDNLYRSIILKNGNYDYRQVHLQSLLLSTELRLQGGKFKFESISKLDAVKEAARTELLKLNKIKEYFFNLNKSIDVSDYLQSNILLCSHFLSYPTEVLKINQDFLEVLFSNYQVKLTEIEDFLIKKIKSMPFSKFIENSETTVEDWINFSNMALLSHVISDNVHENNPSLKVLTQDIDQIFKVEEVLLYQIAFILKFEHGLNLTNHDLFNVVLRTAYGSKKQVPLQTLIESILGYSSISNSVLKFGTGTRILDFSRGSEYGMSPKVITRNEEQSDLTVLTTNKTGDLSLQHIDIKKIGSNKQITSKDTTNILMSRKIAAEEKSLKSPITLESNKRIIVIIHRDTHVGDVHTDVNGTTAYKLDYGRRTKLILDKDEN